MNRSLLSSLRRRIAFRSENYFAPSYSRDTFLVSYPRSGNTWLRCIIASIMTGEHVSNLASIDFVVPDIHFSVPNSQVKPLPSYVVKTHDHLLRGTRSDLIERAVYITRDPRDVCVSYWRYFTKGEGVVAPFTSFSEDFVANRIWPGSWVSHVESWTHSDKDVLFLRYEDIVRDPTSECLRLAGFIGKKYNESEVQTIVSSYTKNEMVKLELAGNRKTFSTKEQFFIGTNAGTDNRQIIDNSPEWKRYFSENCRLLSSWGYYW